MTKFLLQSVYAVITNASSDLNMLNINLVGDPQAHCKPSRDSKTHCFLESLFAIRVTYIARTPECCGSSPGQWCGMLYKYSS